jgi:death on curing protein
MSSDWVWINPIVILAIHEEQLAEHGGPPGVRDQALLDSALARAKNLALYGLPDGSAPKASDPAAVYAHAIAKNHPFIDGNKRTALVAAELFLALNGFELQASDEECVMITLSLAAGEINETELAAWFEKKQKLAK